MKIVVYGASLKNNFGGPSLLYGAYEIWKDIIPDLEIVFIDYAPSKDAEIAARQLPLKVIIMPMASKRKWLFAVILYKLFGLSFGRLEKELLGEFASADAVVDLWGIAFSDKLGMPKSWLRNVYRRLYHVTARLLKKKFIKYTSSFGPIYVPRTRRFARKFLGNMTDLIICREQNSRKVLEELGIKTSLLVCPDSALAMKPQPITQGPCLELFEQGPIIALSVSHQIIRQWKSQEDYFDILVGLIENCIQEFGCQFLLIPNEIGFANDDVCVADNIYQRCSQKESVHILPVETLSAPQLKYVISRCEMMLASRYHSIVAGLSTGVPTVVIGWHYKYDELLSHFGQSEYLLNCETCSMNEIQHKIKKIWEGRKEIHQDILNHYPDVRKELDQGALALLDVLNRGSIAPS